MVFSCRSDRSVRWRPAWRASALGIAVIAVAVYAPMMVRPALAASGGRAVLASTLLVTNTFGPGGVGSGSVTGYPDPDTGCTGTPPTCAIAPSPHISGAGTGLGDAIGIARDASGNIFVASMSTSGSSEVLEYAPGATGDAAPIAILGGVATGLDFFAGTGSTAGGIAIARYHIYVANAGSVTEYSLPLTGCSGTPPICDQEPFATLVGPATGLDRAYGISVDAEGNIWVGEIDDAVTEYAPLASGTQNTPAIATLSGPDTGLFRPAYALVHGNTLFVTNTQLFTTSLTEYPLPLTRCAGAPRTCDEAPSVTLAGSNTGLENASGMAFDSLGNLFVVNQAGPAPSSVTEYSRAQYTTSGDPTPIATIAGSVTDLSNSGFITIVTPVVSGLATSLQPAPVFGPDHPPFLLRATLLAGGKPVAGQSVVFSARRTVLCTSVTDAAGVATCGGRTLASIRSIVAARGYTASFSGSAVYQSSQAQGTLIAAGRVSSGRAGRR